MIQRYNWKRLDIDDYLVRCFEELESVKKTKTYIYIITNE